MLQTQAKGCWGWKWRRGKEEIDMDVAHEDKKLWKRVRRRQTIGCGHPGRAQPSGEKEDFREL